MPANLSALMKWAHKNAADIMATGAKLAVGGERISYQQALGYSISSAWSSKCYRTSFGLVRAVDAAYEKKREAESARLFAAHEARDLKYASDCKAWAEKLSDGQLVSAIFKAETQANPLYTSIRNDWQASSDNDILLAQLRAESAARNAQNKRAA